MSSGPAQRTLDAARRLLKTLLANGETRFRLAVLELEEERARLLGLIAMRKARQHTLFKETLKQFATDRALLELEQDAKTETQHTH